MSKVNITYKEVKAPIQKIEVEDAERLRSCDSYAVRNLVAQKSKSLEGAITIYVSGCNDSRVRIMPDDVPGFTKALNKLATEIKEDR